MRKVFEADGSDVKRFLSSYRRADHAISLQLREIDRLKTIAQQVSTAVTPGMRSDAIGRIQALEAEAAESISGLCVLRQKIEHVIGQIEGDTHREVLQRYYLQAQTLSEIALELNYSRRHISRLHQAGLEAAEQVLTQAASGR